MPDEPKMRHEHTFVSYAPDYHITGSMLWRDISSEEQDQYILACFESESLRREVELELDLFDRAASSVADGLLGTFRQYDINTGESHYKPESAARVARVLRIRQACLRGTRLGARLEMALARSRGLVPSAQQDFGPVELRFESVGPQDNLGLHVLDDRDHGGYSATNPYDGDWGDWCALETHQSWEFKTLERDRECDWTEFTAAIRDRSLSGALGPAVEGSNAPAPMNQVDDVISGDEGHETASQPMPTPGILTRIAWAVSPPLESRIAMAAAMNVLSGHVAGVSPVLLICRTVLKNHALVLHRVRSEGCRPEELGLTVARNVCADALCSGNYHVYRGVLSMAGEQIMSGYLAACREMVARGYADQTEIDDELRLLRQEIKSVG